MKRDLIILHGALGCKGQFTEWANLLSTNFNCHLFDFPGHGSRSVEEVEFFIEEFADELICFIKEKGLKQPNVLGYSMGGYVALFAALQNENPLGRIMTLATKFDWNLESSKKEAGYLKPELMLQKVPQLAEQLKQRQGANWEKVVEKTARMMIYLGCRTLITTKNIVTIKNHVNFSVGEMDKMVSVAETESMHVALPGSALRILKETGHLPETMDTKLVVAEAESFLLRKAKK